MNLERLPVSNPGLSYDYDYLRMSVKKIDSAQFNDTDFFQNVGVTSPKLYLDSEQTGDAIGITVGAFMTY